LWWILLWGIVAPAGFGEEIARLQFLGEARLQPMQLFNGAVVGGLSGITYDLERDQYYAISDDQGVLGPPRLLTLRIDLEGGTLGPDGVSLTGVTELLTRNGGPMGTYEVDGEGIVLTDKGSLVVSSEGNVDRGVDPFVREYSRDGALIRNIPLPKKILPDDGGNRGIRNNLGLESLALAPGGRILFTAVENAVVQDGPEADLDKRSPARILKLDLGRGRVEAEFLYWVEPIPTDSTRENGFRNNGLVELLAIDEETLLALERSFAAGVGNSIRLYRISLTGATDIRRLKRLDDVDLETITPVEKVLLLDLDELGSRLDNLEGMAFGPVLPDGRRTLLMISDDNFNRRGQVTQVLAFAVSDEPSSIQQIQGYGHSSPLTGDWLWGVEGVVTAVIADGTNQSFWMQTTVPDDDQGTSDGLFVAVVSGAPEIAVGDTVAVDGRVEEWGRDGGLTVTRLLAKAVRILSQGNPLPRPLRLGVGGRLPPGEVIEDDGLQFFEPEVDGLDFYESLEGMRIEIVEPVVVGPTSSYGEIVVVGDAGSAASLRSSRGGLVVRPGDGNPERLVVSTRLVTEAPPVASGDRFGDPIVGVMDYGFGQYLVLATPPLPPVESAPPLRNTTELRGGGSRLTLSTYNVANLDAEDDEERFTRLAGTIVGNLASPDILALQEIQDNNGPVDDGVVAADRTFGRLIDAIVTAGGPRYEYCQIDPVDGEDGGQPGGNIRVGYLYRPARVELVERATDNPQTWTRIEAGPDGPRLSRSPGRVAPEDPAFAGDPELGLEAARKSLAAEFVFRGRRLLLINNHWKSKRGDDPLMGARQPPLARTESQRSRQARVIREFADEWLSQDSAAGVVVLGDLNELVDRTPMRVLTATGLIDLTAQVPPADRYTFIYRGNSQVLDHIVLSADLFEQAAPRLDIVHLNADYADGDRASDHDPIVVELDLSRERGQQ
jgi:predicted extracellular nuclease